ncbi:tripartite tricarboxylate transporter substrate binding protein [Bordetella sputigena]|uniref:Bug family tripartite tricarboxylate transporter substrate binding protein n=1 Tax=Bordetella sputigena TaxID=1416810 RepID=UPI0039EF63E4
MKQTWLSGTRTWKTRLCGALLALCVAGAASAADDYPSHPINIIVPFSVGGSTDLVARLEAKALGQELNTSVVVENRTGGGGVIGWGGAARSAPDGYTLLTQEMSYAIAARLIKNLPYDPNKAFTNITTLVQVPHVLVVHPSVPAKTVQEFIALVKAHPDRYFFGSGGVGTNTHLGGELFNSLAGVKMSHIPFRGAGAALQDLLAGRVQAMITSVPTALAQIRSGKLRALMVASDHRIEVLPDVPDAKESGLPGMDMQFWVGFAAPAGTPKPVIDKLNAAMVKSLQSPDMRAQLRDLALEPVGSTPEQAAKLVRDEIARWHAVMEKAGIKPE